MKGELNMKKKILTAVLASMSMLTMVAGCQNSSTDSANSEAKTSCEICTVPDVTLQDIIDALNDNEEMNMKLANAVAVIPFVHINGPRNEWNFYAFVNFQYPESRYVKYQVTYLSCTCRAANVNYWQTAYVELSLPKSGETADDITLRTLSFDQDGTGHYTAGFWGDSNPIYDEATGQEVLATYERVDENTPSIKEDFIPLLVGKTKAQIDKYSTIDDMTDLTLPEIYGDKSVATYFTGASVSTNNIIRILHALFEYHAEQYCSTN